MNAVDVCPGVWFEDVCADAFLVDLCGCAAYDHCVGDGSFKVYGILVVVCTAEFTVGDGDVDRRLFEFDRVIIVPCTGFAEIFFAECDDKIACHVFMDCRADDVPNGVFSTVVSWIDIGNAAA